MRYQRLVRAFQLTTLVVVAASCGGGDATGPDPDPVPDPVVTTIEVSPTSATVIAPGIVSLGATVRDQSGRVMIGQVVAWSASDPSVATVNGAGAVSVIRAGSVTITASLEGKSGSATITGLASVANVTVEPDTILLVVGGTTTLQATLRDAQGTAITGRAVEWTTSAPGVVTVTSAGAVTAVGVGQATISAAIEGKSATVQAFIRPPESLLPAPSCVNCLEVVPNALLLRAAGEQQAMQAYVVDGAGQRTLVQPGWSSTSPGTVSVSGSGIVTAVTATGSAQVTATFNGMTSAPVLVVLAAPVAGAMLVTDDKVVGTVVPVDPQAPFGPGYRFRVRLRDLVPQVGQVILGVEQSPIGGRVVSVTPAGPGQSDVEFEVVPLGDMVTNISLDQTIALDHAPITVSPAVQRWFTPSVTPGGGVRLLPRTGRMRGVVARAPIAANEIEVEVGPFECTASGNVGVGFPIALTVSELSITPSLTLDVEGGATPNKFLVSGGLDVRFAARPVVSGAFTGSVECKVVAANLILPIGGFLAVIIGGQVPLGFGFSGEIETSVGEIGVDFSMHGRVDSRFGYECAPTCQAVGTMTNNASSLFQPVVPDIGNGPRVKVAEAAWLFAELKIGSVALPEALDVTLVKARSGFQQVAELAGTESQRSDQAYRSALKLAPFFKASTGVNLSAIGGWLSIELVGFSLEPDLPAVAETPNGSLTISPAVVGGGTAEVLGEMATFTVTLEDVSYLGAYAVEGVEIRWYRDDGNGGRALQLSRPGCTSLAPTSTGQTTFTCQTDFLEEHEGMQEFYAFVRVRLLGVTLPVLLEISDDSRATVVVERPGISVSPPAVTLSQGEMQQFTATVTGAADQSVTWTATGGTITPSGLFTAGGQAGTFTVRATSVPFPDQSATAQVTIQPGVPPVGIENAGLPLGNVGEAYTAQLTAIGGNGSYSFSVAGGELPPGLFLGGGGRISGTPAVAGSYQFQVRVSSGGASSVANFSITIIATNPWLGTWQGTIANVAMTFVVIPGTLGPNRYQMLAGGGYTCFILVQADNATFTGNCSNNFTNHSITGVRNGSSISGMITRISGSSNFVTGPLLLTKIS